MQNTLSFTILWGSTHHLCSCCLLHNVWGVPSSEEVVWAIRQCYNQQIKQDIRCWKKWSIKNVTEVFSDFPFCTILVVSCSSRGKSHITVVYREKFAVDPVCKFISINYCTLKTVSVTCITLFLHCWTSKTPWFLLFEHVNRCLIDNLCSQAMCLLNCSRVKSALRMEDESLAGH